MVRGLCFRPLVETMRDTLEWWDSVGGEVPGEGPGEGPGMTREAEAEVIAAWRASGGGSG